MMSFIKMELENYEKVFNQLIFDILLNSISLNGNENGLMKKTFIEKEKNLLFTTLKNLSSNSELASKLEKMFENKKNSKNLQLLNKLQKCSYYPRMNFLIIDPNNNFLVDNFRVISEILQNKFHFYSYILTNTVDFFNEIPGILLRIFTNFQDNIEVFQNNILVFSVGNIFNNRENIVKIMKFIEDETEKIEIIEIVHKKLISLMNISNLGLILIEKIKKVILNNFLRFIFLLGYRKFEICFSC